MAENTINDFNTLPEQVQINKEDIKKLSDLSSTQSEQIQTLTTKIDTNTAKIDAITSNIANLGWELKTDTSGNKGYIPKNFDENIPYSLTNITDLTQASGLNIYKDTDGYVWSFLSIYIPSEDDFVGIWTGHDDTDGYFCSLSMATPNDKTTYLVVSYIANSDCPQSLNSDKYKEDKTIATMGWVNKYYLTKTDASNTYLSKQDYEESIDKGDIQFTTQGWTKFKAILDAEGQTITLSVPGDLLEHVQVTGTNDLKLQFFYNGHAVFENIYLHPNNSIDDLDYISGAKSTYFTGQAALTLSSQWVALFYIIYQETTGITLHLITTI